MKRIGMGLVGAGFVGPHHIDAVRRLGYVDVVAIAGSSERSAQQKADALGVRKAYGSYQALLDDPDIQVVHNATPNYLHYPVNAAAIAKGKHVISDKPLAMTAAEAKKLLDPVVMTFELDGASLDTTRQPVKAFLGESPKGFVLAQGRVVAPGELAVGSHTLTVTVENDPLGPAVQVLTSQFSIDAAGTGTCI